MVDKELIEIWRDSLKPSISLWLLNTNYEEMGEQDKEEFERDFDEILDLALIGLKHKAQLSQEHTNKRTETRACDCIGRKDAIRWIKTECNPYGKPTLDFESGKRVMKHLEQMPSAQPEPKWIPCSEQLPKQGQKVICQCRANIIKVLKLDAYGDWYQDAEHCYMGGFVIAWMPLPEPYKEGGADG